MNPQLKIYFLISRKWALKFKYKGLKRIIIEKSPLGEKCNRIPF